MYTDYSHIIQKKKIKKKNYFDFLKAYLIKNSKCNMSSLYNGKNNNIGLIKAFIM